MVLHFKSSSLMLIVINSFYQRLPVEMNNKMLFIMGAYLGNENGNKKAFLSLLEQTSEKK